MSYGVGETLGTATTVVGVATLPATGSNSIFAFAAYAAIAIGMTALLLQLAVGIYRLSVKAK